MTGTVRAIRGATQVDADDPALIAEATDELVRAMLDGNDLVAEDVISVLFTVTGDLVSAYPAAAARTGALGDVPLMCATEIPVPGGLPRVIRALAHVVVPGAVERPRHVYLRGATTLRPDLAGRGRSG